MAKSKASRILLAGGGSGGHVVPLLAVAQELKGLGEFELRLWCDKKVFKMAQNLFADEEVLLSRVVAGKMRRYHHLTWWQHLQPAILWPNIVDFFRFGVGLVQSFCKLLIWRPKLVFIKGGYVCLPIGLSAKLLRIKIIVHDSDVIPGLTNRLLSKFATRIMTGFPLENYPNYQARSADYVGIPVKASYRPISLKQQRKIKQDLGFDPDKKILVALGGGLGSLVLNRAVLASSEELSDMQIVLASGDFDYEDLQAQITQKKLNNIFIKPFLYNLDQYVLASDVVLCRAGATTIAELASARKEAIVVPNPKLSGGHQLKNAEFLRSAEAVTVLDESKIVDEPSALADCVKSVLVDKNDHRLDNFHKLAKPDSAHKIAVLLKKEVSGDR